VARPIRFKVELVGEPQHAKGEQLGWRSYELTA
jgi:hypothetical protein